MKKISIIFSLLLAAFAGSIHAQDCATGYCPATITVHHKVGSVSPVGGDITYGVDKNAYTGTTQCWITRNLGATTQATSATDNTAASGGWYWQFNLKQGYSYNGSRAPTTTWITSITDNNNWLAANDPCTLTLGATWRLPTNTEWGAVLTATGMNSGYLASGYSSTLKLHAGGYLDPSGALASRGTYGYYWSSTQSSTTYGYNLNVSSSSASTASSIKAYGFAVRCLRTY